MTPAQWIFHYNEVIRNKDLEDKNTVKILEIILNKMDFLACAIRPEIADKLQKLKTDKLVLEKNIEGVTPNNFPEFWENIFDTIPKAIMIPKEQQPKRKPILPTFKRSELSNKGITLIE